VGFDEVALATPDLRYFPPLGNILRASSACCEEGCSNEENDPYPPRLNGPAPLTRLEPVEGPFLVGLDEARVTSDIGRKDRCEPTFSRVGLAGSIAPPRFG